MNQTPTLPSYIHKVGLINQAPTNKGGFDESNPYSSILYS